MDDVRRRLPETDCCDLELMLPSEYISLQYMSVCSPALPTDSALVEPNNSTVGSPEGCVPVTSLQPNTNCSSSSELNDHEDNTQTKEIVQFHATTSMSDFPTSSQQYETSDVRDFIKIDAKTSTPSMEPCFNPGINFYHRLQILEYHEAHHYFDNGKILTYDLRNFRIMIGKFVCAFLNTNGGTLYFGVTKAGKVVGVQLDHKNEDAVRVDIDSQVKEIKPTVPTSAYYVNFAKVMDTEGKIMNDLKVLEVKVRSPVCDDEYYAFKSVTYIWNRNSVEIHRTSAAI